MNEGLRCTHKSKINSVAHELLLTLSFCAGVWWVGMQRHAHIGSFWVLTTQLDETKCSNQYNMFSMNIRRRLKVIPQRAKKIFET